MGTNRTDDQPADSSTRTGRIAIGNERDLHGIASAVRRPRIQDRQGTSAQRKKTSHASTVMRGQAPRCSVTSQRTVHGTRFEPSVYGERSEEHTSELQSPYDLVCRLLLE